MTTPHNHLIINFPQHLKIKSIFSNILIVLGIVFSGTAYAADNSSPVELCDPSNCQPLAVKTSQGEVVIECARPCKSNQMTTTNSCTAEKTSIKNKVQTN